MTIEEGKKLFLEVLNQYKEETPLDNINALEERLNENCEILKVENSYIFVVVKDSLTKILIEKFYSHRLNDILTSIADIKMGFKFVTEDDANKEKTTIVEKFASPDFNVERSSRKLRGEYTFENFVVGESNRLAFTMAMKVAENPYSVLNPLYLFGDVGLGKTHLMMAIGHYILDRNINANVVYTSAQQFSEDYFYYTNKDKKNIDVFYNKYRSADVLLVDDIQFLQDKTLTQNEFFKVFEYLHENNKQIVITSDRKASELKLMNRLISRFNWGVPADIKTPDNDLRLSILKKKLETLISNPSDVPVSCLQIIANNFTSNVRDLEGALRRFVTYCVSVNLPFTEENVYSVLDGILPNENASKENIENKKISKLIDTVCSYFYIVESDLLSNSRKPNLVYARNICYYIMRNDFALPLKRIGEYFGGKDHTTITYGCDKIKALLSDVATKTDVDYIKKSLED